MMSFYLIKSLYANDIYALQGYCFFLKLGAKNGIKVLDSVFGKEITSKLFSFQSFFVLLHHQLK